MNFNPACKIEECVSRDAERVPLTEVYFAQKTDDKFPPALIATDGRRLVMIPVEADEREVSGLVTCETLRIARERTVKPPEFGGKPSTAHVLLDGDWALIPGYKIHRPKQNYPKWRAIFDMLKPAKLKIALNAELLVGVQRALGCEAVTLEICDAHDAIKVVPSSFRYSEGNVPGAAGVIMPCNADGVGWLEEPPVSASPPAGSSGNG